MTMPSSVNFKKLGPIELSEDNTHFLVRIHPENRDRAKKIVGRQWDGDRKAWVFPKDPAIYEALTDEFQKDADIFDIRKPKTKRPPGIKPPIDSAELEDRYFEDSEDFEDRYLEDIRSIGEGIGEGQEKVYGELEQIREMLGSLKDIGTNQTRLIEEVREIQDEAKKALVTPEPNSQKPKPKIVNFPDSLDFEKQREIELLERTLIIFACYTANNSRSFCDWLSKYRPLREPGMFVTETHQYLMKYLGKLVGEEDPYARPIDLINKAEEDDLLFDKDAPIFDENMQGKSRRKPRNPYIHILQSLNGQRNCFAHPKPSFDRQEKWNRSIIYLMNLAMVWSKVVNEVEDSNG
jgi:hypothetical protein